MSTENDRTDSGLGKDKEAPDSSHEVQGRQEISNTRHGDEHFFEKQEELSNTLEKSELNAEEKGGEKAKWFLKGLAFGTGKKVAETLWEPVKQTVKELIGLGD